MHITTRLAAFALLAFTAPSAPAAWTVTKTTDPMTDETAYHVHAFGSEMVTPAGEYCPQLIVRIVPTGYDAAHRRLAIERDVYLWAVPFRRSPRDTAPAEVTVRFDDAPPSVERWPRSDNLCAVFCPDPTNATAQLLAADKMTVRVRLNGCEMTSVIRVADLRRQLETVRDECLGAFGASRPSCPEPCAKCRDRRFLERWTRCAHCNGTGRYCGGRCPACVNSAKLGMVRKRVACPQCSHHRESSATPESNRIALRQVRAAALRATDNEREAVAGGYFEAVRRKFEARRLP